MDEDGRIRRRVVFEDEEGKESGIESDEDGDFDDDDTLDEDEDENDEASPRKRLRTVCCNRVFLVLSYLGCVVLQWS